MPKDVEEKAIQELKRLESMPPMSAEATVSRNYLDWLIAVPWYKKSKESRDLKRAEAVLNEDHYGLEKIKDRILEFLAVRALVKKPKATILTFSGPPGVGKTSLAKSIARAMNRKFVRLSLGGGHVWMEETRPVRVRIPIEPVEGGRVEADQRGGGKGG